MPHHHVALRAGLRERESWFIWSNRRVSREHGPVNELLTALSLTAQDGEEDVFVGANLPHPAGRIFGGHTLAQALLAAGKTVSRDRLPHSMHGYFLRPGDMNTVSTLAVERLRDGRSFSARRTHALQHGKPILSMIASFQEQQDGFDHQVAMPDVPGPDEGVSVIDLLGEIEHPAAKYWARDGTFEVRHISPPLWLEADPQPVEAQSLWMRCRADLPDDQLLHSALLAYSCDHVMLEPILRRNSLSWTTPGTSIASLDHAMWWHRPTRVDEWLLYFQDSPSSQGGRGLGMAKVFNEAGELVATIAQEGMVRARG